MNKLLATLDCPEVDLLQQVAPLLREKVTRFQDAISGDYIDHPTEREAQRGASRELERLDKAQLLAEGALKFKKDPNLITYIRRTLAETAEKTSIDVINYQRAMIKYDHRVEEFKQYNAIARQFLSPRTRFAQAWEEEERVGRVEYAEVNFLAITLVVFAILIVVATIATNDQARVWVNAFTQKCDTAVRNILQVFADEIYKIQKIALKMKDTAICRMSDGPTCVSKVGYNYSKSELW